MNKTAFALVLALAASGCGKDKNKEGPAEGSGSATVVTPAVPTAPLGSAAAGSGSGAGSDAGSDVGSGSAGDTAAALEKLETEYAEVDKQIEETVAAVEAAKNDQERTTASEKLDKLMTRQKELADQRKALKAKVP